MDDPNAPPDRNKMIYTFFLVHGIGILIPWNMFITAVDYFLKYKFSEEYIGFTFPYIPNFMQYLTFASQVPNITFTWLNVFVRLGGNLTARIVWAILAIIIIFIFTIILAMVDTSGMPYAFFWLTMVCVVLLNICAAVYQNTVFGIVAKFPPNYTGAIILGNNVCGTIVAFISLFSQLGSSNHKIAAIYYFIIALLVLLFCFDSYFALPLSKYYKYYDAKEKKRIESERQQAAARNPQEQERPPYVDILKKVWPEMFNVFLVFLVSLAVFPSIQAGVQRASENFFIPPKYYTSITCFITFNLFAMIGSWIPMYFIWPSAKFLWIPCVIRLIFIPLFLFCNYQVPTRDRYLPVIINNDWVYWILGLLMSLSSGYYSSLAMMYAPGKVDEQHAAIAGMFAGAALITGIFMGIVLSFLWPVIA